MHCLWTCWLSFVLGRRFASSYCCHQSLFSVDGIKEHSATEFAFAMKLREMKDVKQSAQSTISSSNEKRSLQTIQARVQSHCEVIITVYLSDWIKTTIGFKPRKEMYVLIKSLVCFVYDW